MSSQIQAVRRFNRLVTLRAGALEEHFLGRERPLGESRVLFEVGPEGASLKEIRTRLDLDAGYLSRMVRNLLSEGLVRVEPGAVDQRIRYVHLTESGLAEFDEVQRRSDQAASAILEPLSIRQRDRLVAAMDEVNRLLCLSDLKIATTDPESLEARWCLSRYFDELSERFDEGFDSSNDAATDVAKYRPPTGMFLVAQIRGRPVGCGGVSLTDPDTAYLKRMWVDSSLRGLGLGRTMLAALEAAACELGCRVVQLETNRVLAEAIHLYRTSGYEEVPPFNAERYAHHWFVKRIGPAE